MFAPLEYFSTLKAQGIYATRIKYWTNLEIKRAAKIIEVFFTRDTLDVSLV